MGCEGETSCGSQVWCGWEGKSRGGRVKGEAVLMGGLAVVLNAGNISARHWGGGGGPPGSWVRLHREVSLGALATSPKAKAH